MSNDKDILNQKKLVWAINPAIGIDPAKQTTALARLETYLSAAVGVAVTVQVRESYEETLTGMERGEIDVAQLGPYAFALAQTRFGASALANTVELASLDEKDSPAPYRSVIFTRSDSGITSLAQLKGQPFGFVDRNSTTGYLIATFLLQQAGLDPAQQLDGQFQHSHRAVAKGVLSGELAAGATMETEFIRYNQPTERPPLRLLAASPLISKGPVVVRPGLPSPLERRLLAALLRVSQDEPEGAQLLLPPTQRFAPATQRELTLKSIAELAGVSYGTVSRAINGRDRIAPATTARVLKLVEELGYRPNASARSLHKLRGDLVGLVLPGLGYPGLAAIIAGLQAALDEASLQLLLYPLGSTNQEARHKAYFELLYDGRLEGTLLTQWTLRDPAIDQLIRSGKPTSLLEQDLLDGGLQTVANWLHGQGHTRLNLVTGPEALLEPNISRLAFKRLGLAECEIVTPADLPHLFADPDGSNALFCLDDEGLVAAHQLATEAVTPHLILGLGNSPIKRLIARPYLAFEGETLGKIAANRLLTVLNLPINEPQASLKFWIKR